MVDTSKVAPPEQKPPAAAVANPRRVTRENRIPMSTATLKMAVPAIDGFYLYWFAERNMPRALAAGYEFVDRDEVHLNQLGLANDRSVSGNTDLGSRVSMIGSLDGGPNNGPERAYLMKLRQEWRDEDRAEIDARNASILSGVFKDEKIYGPEGAVKEKGNLEYVRTALFNRPTRKAKVTR